MDKNKDNKEYLRKYAPEYVIGQETSKLVDLLSEVTHKLQNIDFQAIEKLQGEQGLPGEKGESPVKGMDYFTEDEIVEIAEAIKEFVKDGENGFTPVKGKDYFTDAEIKQIQAGIKVSTPQETVGYLNSNPGVLQTKVLGDLEDYMSSKFASLNDPKNKFQLDYGRIKNAPQTFYNPNDPSQPYYQVSASGGSGSGAGSFVGTGVQTPPVTGPDYLTTYTPSVPTLTAGLEIVFFPDADSVGNDTLNGVLIKKVTSSGLVNLAAGDLQGGGAYDLIYNGTFWVLVGGTSNGIPQWIALTPYIVDQAVWQTDRLLTRLTVGTSLATFTPAEAATWRFISQSNFPTWAATTFFYGGEQVLLNGALYQANANFTTSATLNTAELTSWTRVTPTKVLNVSSVTTLIEANQTVLNNATGAAYTLTLPTAVGRDGQLLEIKKIDASANGITVDGAGAETIDGALTFVITAQYAGIVIRSDGTNWETIDAYYPPAPFITVTGTTTLSGAPQSVKATNAGTSYTITLPAASSFNVLNAVSITKTDANTNQIVIAGALTPFSLNTQGDSVILRSDGTNWIALADISAQGATGTGVTTWTAATNYETNQLVLNNGTLYQRIAAGTSAATFALDAATWTLIQNYQSIPAFVGSQYYPLGYLVSQGTNRILQRTASGTAAATFTNAEAANYTLVSQISIPTFAGATYYYAGERVTLNQKMVQRITSGTSAGTFSAAEASNWTLISYSPSSWLATTYYYINEVVFSPNTQNLILGIGGLTTVAFNTAEITSGGWIIKTMSGNTRDFVASTYYFVGDLIKDSGVVYRRTIAGDAGATFNAAEKVNWAILSGFPFTTVAANYTVVETDEMIVVTSTTAFTITIPAGRVNPIIKFSTPSLSATPPTITTSGGETITSPTTFALVTSFVMPGTTGLSSSVQFQKIGNNYMFIA